jgi:cell division protein FtsB
MMHLLKLTLLTGLLCDSVALIAMKSQAPVTPMVPTLPAMAQAQVVALRGFNLNQKLDSANKALTFISHGLLIGGGLYIGYKGIQVLRKLGSNDTQERLGRIEEQQGQHSERLDEVHEGVQTNIAKVRSLRTFAKKRFGEVQDTQAQHSEKLTNIQNTQVTQGRAFFSMFRGLFRGQNQLKTNISRVETDLSALRAEQKEAFEKMGAAQKAEFEKMTAELADLRTQNATMQTQLKGIANDSRETVEFVRGLRSGTVRNFPSSGRGIGLLTASNVAHNWSALPRSSTSLLSNKPKVGGKAKNDSDIEE